MYGWRAKSRLEAIRDRQAPARIPPQRDFKASPPPPAAPETYKTPPRAVQAETLPVTPQTPPIDPKFAAMSIDQIFDAAVKQSMTSPSAVKAMKANIRDGNFTVEHYHQMWAERLQQGGKANQAAEEEEAQYQVEKVLGEGGFGIAILATTPDGTKAVMKSPIAASHVNEMNHEGAVLAVLDRARKEWPDARGQHNVPTLVLASGMLSPKMVKYKGDPRDEQSATTVRRAASKRNTVIMSYAGQELAKYHIEAVEAVRAGKLPHRIFLKRVRKIAHDIMGGVHFLADYGQMSHHDLKMFNVAIEPPFSLNVADEPHARVFDFGTTYPCEYIPDSVFGTNAYHPPEVHLVNERREPTAERITEMKEFFEGYLNKLYDKEARSALLHDKLPARYDDPYGACDVFGVGALLAEMIYGIFTQIEHGGNWTNLLFPMSDEDAKQSILAQLDVGKNGKEKALRELKQLMMRRCEFPNDFKDVIDDAFEFGAGDLILQCLESDPHKRLGAEAALDHPFFTAQM